MWVGGWVGRGWQGPQTYPPPPPPGHSAMDRSQVNLTHFVGTLPSSLQVEPPQPQRDGQRAPRGPGVCCDGLQRAPSGTGEGWRPWAPGDTKSVRSVGRQGHTTSSMCPAATTPPLVHRGTPLHGFAGPCHRACCAKGATHHLSLSLSLSLLRLHVRSFSVSRSLALGHCLSVARARAPSGVSISLAHCRSPSLPPSPSPLSRSRGFTCAQRRCKPAAGEAGEVGLLNSGNCISRQLGERCRAGGEVGGGVIPS